jgi:RNA:NAD 2'-phosphotransferase (TPT1/KptA family)
MRLDPGQIEVVDDAMAEVLRHKSPAARIKIGFDLWISPRKMLTHHLQKTHPDWDEKTIEREVARRFLNVF